MPIPLLFLHGAIGASSQLKLIVSHIDNEIYTLNFPGHGGTPLPGQFSISSFAQFVLNFIKENNWQTVNIFGYSMGGYVGMYMARHYPELINKVATLGTKFHWDKETVEKEVKLLDPVTIITKIPKFARSLEEMHAPTDWKKLLKLTADMLLQMGNENPLLTEDFAAIKVPVLLMLGDRDKMVTPKETVNVYQSLPNAQMAILPGTPHAVEQLDASTVAWFLKKFFEESV